MADNYLEKRYDEVFNSQKTKTKRVGPTLDDLLLRNRSCRGYLKDFVVTDDMLRRIVAVNSRVPSALNQQALRFFLATRDNGADFVLQNIKMGGMLPDLHLPFAGTEPEAFIIVCATVPESKNLYIDMGISMQSMLLKAVEMGLSGLIIASVNFQALIQHFNLQHTPYAVVAIGKSSEHVEIVPVNADDSLRYYRKDGVHYVPKIKSEQLIINK